MLACAEVTDLIDCKTSNRSREIVKGGFLLAGPFVDSWEIVSMSSLVLSRIKRFPPKKLILNVPYISRGFENGPSRKSSLLPDNHMRSKVFWSG